MDKNFLDTLSRDGDGKTISNLKIVGKNFGGLVGQDCGDKIENCTASGTVSKRDEII